MANEVIIEFKADTRGLEPALAILEKTGQVDKKTADQVRNDNKAWSDREQAIKKVNEEQKKAADPKNQIKPISSDTVRSFSDFKNVISDLGKTIGVAFATEQIIQFGKETVKAFQDAEQNALKLKTAVSVNGGLSEDFDTLIDQSSKLQDITIFSDDAIQQMQTAALQFGLTSKQVEKLTPIIVDFASATGQDLSSALSNVISGINGNARALKQYGVSLEDGLSKSEQLVNITEQLTKKFNGQAIAIGETSAGAAAKLSNRFDDLKEKIGGFISGATDATSILLNWALNGFQPVNDESEQLSANLFKNADALRTFGLAALSANISILEQKIAITDNAEALKELQKQLDTLRAKKITLEIGGLSDAELKQRIDNLDAVKFKFKEQSDELKILQDEYKKRNLDVIISEKDLTKLTNTELQNRLNTLKAADKESNNIAITDAIDAVQKELAIRAAASKKLLEQRKKDEKEWSEFLDKSLSEQHPEKVKVSEKDRNNNFPSREEFDKWQKEFVQLQLKADAELNKKREQDAKEFAEKRRDIETQIATETIQGLFDIYTSSIDNQISAAQDYQDYQNKQLDDRLAKNKQNYDDELISARTFRANEKTLLDQKTANEIAAQKKINELKRQAAIANKIEKLFEIAINTASSIIKTEAQLGAIAAAPLIPYLIALGATQAGVVAAQPIPKYHTGRLAKGAGEEFALIQKEETITSAKKSKEYAPTLEAIHYGKIPAMALNDFVRSFTVKDVSHGTPSVSVNMDPDKFAAAYGWQVRGQEQWLKKIYHRINTQEPIDYRSIRH